PAPEDQAREQERQEPRPGFGAGAPRDREIASRLQRERPAPRAFFTSELRIRMGSVRFDPGAPRNRQQSNSSDDFVCQGQDFRRNRDADATRTPEIDNELVSRGALERYALG